MVDLFERRTARMSVSQNLCIKLTRNSREKKLITSLDIIQMFAHANLKSFNDNCCWNNSCRLISRIQRQWPLWVLYVMSSRVKIDTEFQSQVFVNVHNNDKTKRENRILCLENLCQSFWLSLERQHICNSRNSNS